MGLSHSLNGAHASATLDSVVNGFIQKQGGVRGVISQFEKQGLGPAIQSWAGKGEHHPISGAQILRALGFVALQQLGGQLGVSPDDMAAKLSKVLPKAIAKATADGSRTPTPTRTGWRYFTSSTR
jgi:uncharacterized protein YidB (DUF937 family)